MSYKIRPGIVKTKICGVNYLIPTRAASEHCTGAMRLSFFMSAIFDMIAKEKSEEEIYRMYHRFSKKSEAESVQEVDRIIQHFYKHGYLIESISDGTN